MAELSSLPWMLCNACYDCSHAALRLQAKSYRNLKSECEKERIINVHGEHVDCACKSVHLLASNLARGDSKPHARSERSNTGIFLRLLGKPEPSMSPINGCAKLIVENNAYC